MTQDEIETAVGQHLAGMGSTPIAWPNADFTPNGAYIEFRHAPNAVEDPVISGGHEYATGIFLMTAVVPAGQFSGAGNALAQSIADRFPKALRLDAGDGKVVFNAPCSFGTPFQDGSYWRQPVRAFYITE